jgi:hypothetical protein
MSDEHVCVHCDTTDRFVGALEMGHLDISDDELKPSFLIHDSLHEVSFAAKFSNIRASRTKLEPCLFHPFAMPFKCGNYYRVTALLQSSRNCKVWMVDEDYTRLILGASKKVLAQHLRKLEADGIIVRKDMSDMVLHIEYELSRDFRHVVCDLLDRLSEAGAMYLAKSGKHVEKV